MTCPHPYQKWIVAEVGREYYSAESGQIEDNIREIVICGVCGHELSKEEIDEHTAGNQPD